LAGAGEGGAVWSSSQIWMTNSTITANRGSGGSNFYTRAPGGPGNGGGIALTGGTASLVNITITANTVDATGIGTPPPPARRRDLPHQRDRNYPRLCCRQ
jgi:hypothetical protein